ncbi:MAG: DUF5915 domain-containing protein, partial [Hadesarchaea archaeon]|nr:DUF5915 domain-containing protein [Hadesarchaea archaeon]
AGAAARQKADLKLRWPVAKAIVKVYSEEVASLVRGLRDVLRRQLNCKELVLLSPGEYSAELRLVCRPNSEALERKFGGLARSIVSYLAKMDASRLRAELQRYGFAGLQVDGRKVRITKEDVDFEEVLPEGYVSAEVEVGKVMLDARLTPELKAECLARELVRRLQTMRKELDLAMEERVDVEIGVYAEEHLKLLASQQDYIVREVRVRNLRLCSAGQVSNVGYSKDWDIDGDKFKLLLRRPSG